MTTGHTPSTAVPAEDGRAQSVLQQAILKFVTSGQDVTTWGRHEQPPTCPNTRHHPYHHSSNSEVRWVRRVDCKNWRYLFLNPLTALFLTIPSTFNKQLLTGWWKEKRWPKSQTLERPEWHHQEHLTQRWQLWRCSWSHNRNSQVAAEALTTETGKPFTFGKPAQALGRKVYASNIASHPEIQFHKHPIVGFNEKVDLSVFTCWCLAYSHQAAAAAPRCCFGMPTAKQHMTPSNALTWQQVVGAKLKGLTQSCKNRGRTVA